MDEVSIDDWTPSVGRARAIEANQAVLHGSRVGFNWRLTWDDPDAGCARLSVFDRSRPAWEHTIDGWRSFSALLGGLAASWDWLLVEQVFPCRAQPERPSLLAVELDRLVHGDQAAAAFETFRRRHDCSSWFQETTEDVSPFWIVREGDTMLFEAGSRVFRSPLGSAVHALRELGEAIVRFSAGRLVEGVAEAWHAKEEGSEIRLTAIDLATSETRVGELLRRGVFALRPRREVLMGLDPVMAAARALASRLSDDELARIAEHIRRQPHAAVPALDTLAVEAVSVIDECKEERGFHQGRRLASWLRATLGLDGPGLRFEPDDLLARWGIAVVPISTKSRIEAVAFWSGEHGPAILLNRDGRSNSGRGRADWMRGGGTRATLAHEICHLLVDRGRRLPAAEALGGDGPEELEERAREFAAEVLLPHSYAGDAYRGAHSCGSALQSLTMKYGVSRTLAAFQILKCFSPGSPVLSDPDRRLLEEITS